MNLQKLDCFPLCTENALWTEIMTYSSLYTRYPRPGTLPYIVPNILGKYFNTSVIISWRNVLLSLWPPKPHSLPCSLTLNLFSATSSPLRLCLWGHRWVKSLVLQLHSLPSLEHLLYNVPNLGILLPWSLEHFTLLVLCLPQIFFLLCCFQCPHSLASPPQNSLHLCPLGFWAWVSPLSLGTLSMLLALIMVSMPKAPE